MKLVIPEQLLLRAVEALEHKAHTDAAHSQAPDLVYKEHTQEWADAKAIRQAIRNAQISAKVKSWRP